MSYTINLTNGSTLIPGGLSDGTVDTSHTSLTLIGKDYAGYGQFLNENFVYLLENFASTSSPANPLKGQLWWDTTNNILKVYSGSSWKISTGATSAPFSAPPGDLSALGGDLWWDTTNAQLKVYSGSSWVVVGPQATSVLQTTGAFAATIADTAGASHKIIQLQFNGVVYAIFAYETFSTIIPGFLSIRAGINFNTSANPAWQLSNQDVNANPNTLVQRDSGGGIRTGAITAGAITATTVTASSTINGTFNGALTGDVTATNITASTITTQGITATSGIAGTLSTAAQPNITGLGTIQNLTTAGTTNLNGLAYYNGAELATKGGAAPYAYVDNAPINPYNPNTGRFSTLTVTALAIPASTRAVDLGATTNYWNNFYATNGNFFSNVNAVGMNTTSLNTTTAVASGAITGGNFLFSNGVSVVGATLSAVAAVVVNIPNSALQNSTMTLNGTTVALGQTATITAAAGTLTGSTLNSSVTTSSLTSVGTLGGLTVSGTSSLNRVSITGGGTGIGSASALNVVGDATVARSANAGVLYLGSNGSHYLYFDGTNYNMPAGGLVQGGTVTASSFTTGSWNIVASGTKIFFQYNGTNVASLDSSGNFISLGNQTAYATP